MPVEQIHEGKAHGRRQEPRGGMQHRIPYGDLDIECLDLSQDLRREDKHQYDDLKGIRQMDIQTPLQNIRHIEQNQGQHTQEHILIITSNGRHHQR